MQAQLLLRLQVEDLLYQEADLLDQWRLDEWLALFTEDAQYLVPPTDLAGEAANPNTSLFYVFDDRRRMQERVIRLKKVTAHSESPRSKVRHLVSNVRVSHEGATIHARASFAVWRSKDATSDVFVGHYLYELAENGGDVRIRKKTCVLDMEALRPHARISIIL
jgi:p-cumate 2,3-dioxygenase subunit beta